MQKFFSPTKQTFQPLVPYSAIVASCALLLPINYSHYLSFPLALCCFPSVRKNSPQVKLDEAFGPFCSQVHEKASKGVEESGLLHSVPLQRSQTMQSSLVNRHRAPPAAVSSASRPCSLLAFYLFLRATTSFVTDSAASVVQTRRVLHESHMLISLCGAHS